MKTPALLALSAVAALAFAAPAPVATAAAAPAPAAATTTPAAVPVGVTPTPVAAKRAAGHPDQRRPRPRPAGTPHLSRTVTHSAVRGAALGARSVLTIRAQFRETNGGVLFNEQTEPWDVQDVRERVFTHPGSASNIFAAQSGGAQSLRSLNDPSGDVSGWVRMNTRAKGCNVDAIENDAALRQAAQALGAARYDHLLVIFPYNKDCDWGGLADSPGSVAWINGLAKEDYGRTSDVSLEWDASMVAHELAHNLGVDHANSVACWTGGGAWTPLSANCAKPVEYGDPFDLMGGGMEKVTQNFHGTQLMSSWHRAQMGHLPLAAQQTVFADGAYSLAQPNAAGGVRLLRIPRGALGPGITRATQEIVLETRTDGPLFDRFSLDPKWFAPGAPLGVLIRVAPTVDRALPSQLVDMKPRTKTLMDAPLRAGGTFTDPVTGITVRLDAIDGAGNAQVTVRGILNPSPDGRTPVLAAPSPLPGGTPIPGNRRVKVHFPGAGKITATAYGYRLGVRRSPIGAYTLPSWLGGNATVKLVASGGTLGKKVTAQLRLRGGKVSLKVVR